MTAKKRVGHPDDNLIGKFKIVGDLHLHNHHQFGWIDKKGVNQRLKDGIRVLDYIMTHCIRDNIKTVFFLGDIFENKRSVPTDVLSIALQKFRQFKEHGMNLIFLLGNHDRFNVSDKINFHTLEGLRDVGTIIDKPTLLSIDSTDFYMVPYSDYKDGILHSLYDLIDKSPTSNNVKVLMLHDEIGGIKYDNGTVSSSPLKYEHLQPEYFSYIFAGHIHKRTEYLNLIYVGSSCQLSFAESGDTKGYYALKVYKGGKSSVTFGKNRYSKQFIITEYSGDDFFEKTININEGSDYYKIKIEEGDIPRFMSDKPKIWLENKTFIFDISESKDDIQQIETDEDMTNFNLKEMSIDYITSNEIVFEKHKLDKDLIVDLLVRMGAI